MSNTCDVCLGTLEKCTRKRYWMAYEPMSMWMKYLNDKRKRFESKEELEACMNDSYSASDFSNRPIYLQEYIVLSEPTLEWDTVEEDEEGGSCDCDHCTGVNDEDDDDLTIDEDDVEGLLDDDDDED